MSWNKAKKCKTCNKELDHYEKNCSGSLCFEHRKGRITIEHFKNCYSCKQMREQLFKPCPLCNEYYTDLDFNCPSNCEKHLYCLDCLNNRRKKKNEYSSPNTYSYSYKLDERVRFMIKCNNCELYFRHLEIVKLPPNCYLCGLFSNGVGACVNHAFCSTCRNFLLIKGIKGIDRIKNCNDCFREFDPYEQEKREKAKKEQKAKEQENQFNPGYPEPYLGGNRGIQEDPKYKQNENSYNPGYPEPYLGGNRGVQEDPKYKQNENPYNSGYPEPYLGGNKGVQEDPRYKQNEDTHNSWYPDSNLSGNRGVQEYPKYNQNENPYNPEYTDQNLGGNRGMYEDPKYEMKNQSDSIQDPHAHKALYPNAYGPINSHTQSYNDPYNKPEHTFPNSDAGSHMDTYPPSYSQKPSTTNNIKIPEPPNLMQFNNPFALSNSPQSKPTESINSNSKFQNSPIKPNEIPEPDYYHEPEILISIPTAVNPLPNPPRIRSPTPIPIFNPRPKLNLSPSPLNYSQLCSKCNTYPSIIVSACNHSFCEFCLILSILKDPLIKFFSFFQTPQSLPTLFTYTCYCAAQFTVYYPMSQLMTVSTRILQNYSQAELGQNFEIFKWILDYSQYLTNYAPYLEGLPCTFVPCSQCSNLSFQLAGKPFCPWH